MTFGSILSLTSVLVPCVFLYSISEGNTGHHVNISNQEQGNLAYAIAHGDSSSASANVSMCQQLEMCMQLLQERDRQLQEKDNQIQQLHQMLQVLINKEV